MRELIGRAKDGGSATVLVSQLFGRASECCEPNPKPFLVGYLEDRGAQEQPICNNHIALSQCDVVSRNAETGDEIVIHGFAARRFCN